MIYFIVLIFIIRLSKSRTKNGEQAKAPTLTETAKSAYFTPLKTKHSKTRRRNSKAQTGPSTSEIDSIPSELSTISFADGLAAASTSALQQVDEARQMMAADGSTASTMEASPPNKGGGDDSLPYPDSVNAAPAPRMKAKHAKLLRIAAEQTIVI